MRSRALITLSLLLLLVGAAALFFVCGKTGKSPLVDMNDGDVRGTYCEVLARLPPRSAPQTPAPDHPVLKTWVEALESATEEHLAFRALSDTHNRWAPLNAAESVCIKRLAASLMRKLPARNRLRRRAISEVEYLADASLEEQGKKEKEAEPKADKPTDVLGWLERLTEAGSSRDFDEDCRDVEKFLGHFPDNARLRRMLALHFGPCVEDNFNSIDGPLNRNEIFIRLTAETAPDRLAIDFDLLVDADDTSRTGSTMVWQRTAFGRTALDLGKTGNALVVLRDIAKKRPGLVRQLLPTAKRMAQSTTLPSHRRARWVALVAYIEAGSPDPGDPAEPALARALDKDLPSARWAFGFLPNELEEHAPRPYPYVRDPDLIRAATKRAESIPPGAIPSEEDTVLALDALSRMPPGTALPWIVKTVGSTPTAEILKASLSAINRQLEQLPLDSENKELTEADKKLPPREIEYEEQPRAQGTAKLLKPELENLRAALKGRVCLEHDALKMLLQAEDRDLDAEYAACLKAADAKQRVRGIEAVFSSCLGRRDLGWQLTAKVIAEIAAPGDNGQYSRRIAKGCETGKD